MNILLFEHRFAEAILKGRKRLSIRPHRITRLERGDELSLRCWSPKQSSAQIVIATAICTAADQIRLGKPLSSHENHITCYRNCIAMSKKETDRIARLDGHHDARELIEHITTKHGKLPFDGDLIEWEIKQ